MNLNLAIFLGSGVICSVGVAGLGVAGEPAAGREIAIQWELPGDAPAGERPYLIEWAKRQESPPAQVAFENLRDWRALVRGGVDVTVEASREKRIWRSQVAKVAWSVRRDEPSDQPKHEGPELKAPTLKLENTAIELLPPADIPIKGTFDAVNLWLHGPGQWGYQCDFAVVLRDAHGQLRSIPLTTCNAGWACVQHGILPDDFSLPASLHSIILSDLKNPGSTLYLESIALYQENRQPYSEGPPPNRPFPTSPDGMLPTCSAGKTSVGQQGDSVLFTYRGDDGTLTYTITPKMGTLSDVSARWNDGRPISPAFGGGIYLAAGGKTDIRLVGRSLADGVLQTEWESKAKDVTAGYKLTYQLRGKTLVVDAQCPGGNALVFQLGEIKDGPVQPVAKTRESEQAQRITIPYLRAGRVDCRQRDRLFVSAFLDWHCSNASVIGMTAAEYRSLTDGSRHDLRERILLTLSPEFTEVLPNIANPPSPHRAEMAPYLCYMGGFYGLAGPQPRFWSVLKRYGLNHLIALTWSWWDETGEDYPIRWLPRREMSVEQMAGYARAIRELGYRFGLLVCFSEFMPSNPYWDENLISLLPNGNWRSMWISCYATKPNAMRMLARKVGGEIARRYPTQAVYLDVHTNRGLSALDYEAGVPGAGIARATVEFNMDAILEVQKNHGFVISEGAERWLYAGVVDADYACDVRWYQQILPPLVDFDLLKLHPLAHGVGMGCMPVYQLPEELANEVMKDDGRGPPPIGFYARNAMTLAYGQMGMLGYEYRPPLNRTIKYYAMLEGLGREYLSDSVTQIARHDGESFVSTSQAILDGSLNKGRLRIRYSRGLELWINYNATETWEVEITGRRHVLPPWGWVAIKPGEILAYSALVDGRRVDYVRCPEYTYLDTGDRQGSEGGITLRGAVLLVREGEGWRVIPCGDLGPWRWSPNPEYFHNPDADTPQPPADRGCGEIVIGIDKFFPGKTTAQIRATGRDDAGETVEPEIRVVDTMHLKIQPAAGVQSVGLSPQSTQR